MGVVKFGINGHYNGRIGDVVFYMLMGKQVSRRVGKNLAAPSLKQLINRLRMRIVSDFLRTMMPFINIGYALVAGTAGIYPQNAAVSYLKKNALKGEYPDIEIDFERVMLSRGSLGMAQNAAVTLVPEGLKFSWNYDASAPAISSNDQVMVMAYFPLEHKAIYEIGIARRVAGTAILLLPANVSGTVETYISFAATNGKAISDSMYTGSVNL